MEEHNIYVQSINYPTVARGEERLRITVTPRHTLEQMDKLIRAVDKIFVELGIKRTSAWKAAGGRAGVGISGAEHVDPIWTPEQMGLTEGTTPKTLRDGQPNVVDARAAKVARARFNNLLGPVVETPRIALTAVRGPRSVIKDGGVSIPLATASDSVQTPISSTL